MNKKISINLPGLILVYVLFMASLIYTHSSTLVIVLTLMLGLFASYLLGSTILAPVRMAQQMLSMSRTILATFIGSFLLSMLVFIATGQAAMCGMLALITGVLLFVNRRCLEWTLKPTGPDIVAFVIAVTATVLISGDELQKEFTSPQIGWGCYSPDHYFFTSIVASIRRGSIFSAAYELNSPINYQLFGFFIPAFWADLLNITSHQALWGLSLPFYKMATMLFSYELSYFFVKEKVLRTNYIFIFAAIILPLLLAPLHPLYLIKFDPVNFIFNGCGYLVPAGTITYPVTIALMLFCLLLFCTINWQERKISTDKLLFISGLSLMSIGKVPLFFGFTVFIGTIVIKRIVFNKERISNYSGYIAGFLVLTYFIYKTCLGQSSGNRTYIKYGYWAELICNWYHKAHLNAIAVILLTILTFIIWMGLRLAGFITLATNKNKYLNEFVYGSIVSLLAATTLASFVRMEMIDSKGAVAADVTFNVQQFVRSSYYIVSTVSVCGMLLLLFGGLIKRKYITGLSVLTVLWCMAALAAIYTFTYKRRIHCEEYTWYYDNYDQLKTGKYNDGLIVVNPATTYCGIMLSSSDYGRYWSAMDRSEGNYNSSSVNSYRWKLFKEFLNNPEERYVSQMKQEGVKYIISTPPDSLKMANIAIALPKQIEKVPGTIWIYRIK